MAETKRSLQTHEHFDNILVMNIGHCVTLGFTGRKVEFPVLYHVRTGAGQTGAVCPVSVLYLVQNVKVNQPLIQNACSGRRK